jgi:S-DNA-T family DNA segregation ATPase FtsK/SpoIIIE
MPERVRVGDLPPPTADASDVWSLPVGLEVATLEPAWLQWYPGEHVLIAGPPRSGRSSALATVAKLATAARPGLRIAAVSPRCPLADLPADLDLLLVDDAERVDDPTGRLAGLLRRGDVRVAAAGRADAVRSAYGHWTQQVRLSRSGVLLRRHVDLDGDLLGALLPRRLASTLSATGRGVLIANGDISPIQLAICE